MQKTRVIGAVLALGLGLGLSSACNRKGEGEGKGLAATAAAVAPATAGAPVAKEELDQEENLLSARGDLNVNRKRISERRQELLKEREQLTQAAAADPQALARLQTEDQKLLAEEQDLAKKERELLSKLEDVTRRAEKRIVEAQPGGGDPAAGISRREGALARRESELARREADLTARERLHLAARAKALDECRAQPVQTITRVEVPAGGGGGRYTRRDIEPLMREVHKQMRARGILETDLSGAGPLFGAVSRANQTGDFTRAKFSAEQLLELVKSTRIDRAFIGAKIDRLQARMRGTALPGATKGDVDRLFRQATASYGDGQFPVSNGALNRIYGLLR